MTDKSNRVAERRLRIVHSHFCQGEMLCAQPFTDSDRNLIMKGVCSRCQQPITWKCEFSKLPRPDSHSEIRPIIADDSEGVRKQDKKFLRALKIAVDDDESPPN
jgi:hypothetical protein